MKVASGSCVARYYDPRTSVWQSVDPILGSYLDGDPNGGVFSSLNTNLYGYVYQNPIKYRDPTGKCPDGQIGVIGGGSAYCRDMTWGESNPTLSSILGDIPALFNRHDGVAVNPISNQFLSGKEEFDAKFSLATLFAPASKTAAAAGGAIKQSIGAAKHWLKTKTNDVLEWISKNIGKFSSVTSRFKHGELFDHTIQTSKGPVDFLAETVIKGDTLILKDVAVFGRKGSEALKGVQKEIFRGSAELKQFAREQGFKRLEITGRRVENSSSARPGHDVNLGWDL